MLLILSYIDPTELKSFSLYLLPTIMEFLFFMMSASTSLKCITASSLFDFIVELVCLTLSSSFRIIGLIDFSLKASNFDAHIF